ncbi:MAG: pelota-like protein, partial [Acidilobaceae archaeon]
RKPMILKLRIEKLEFQLFTGALRLSGIVVEGPEEYSVIGRHHTAQVKPGDVLVIEREEGWSDRVLKKLEESGYKGSALIVSIDYDEYAIALLTSLGLKVLEEGYSRIPSKGDDRREEALERYVDEIVAKVADNASRHSVLVVIVSGPGPLKEAIAEKLRKALPDKRLHVDETATGGVPGVNEVLRRASVLDALRDFAIIEAESLLEEFMSLVSRDPERVAYGLADVLACLKAGAVEKMVIADSLLFSFRDEERRAAEMAMEEAERRRARVVIVPRESPPGERVSLLGGVIAKLRYRLPLEARRSIGGAEAES